MKLLNGAQRKELRAQAHHLTPIVLIGTKGVTETVVESVNQALEAHELIKIKFNDHKDEKRELTDKIAEATQCEVAGLMGNVAILYRANANPEKRKITFST
ncbi:MAG: ribosome assembly RNA-binding protein YhbY [Candidatus Hydrogenedentota bacterium]|nr:MAG: ribosome assembly RNA-binding protein YhbY [Candidatus Hydrogenedentota bacterium]